MALNKEMMEEYAKIAYYYYKVGLTQDKIAARMNVTRQTVNRILKKCVELGIVQITIHGLENSNVELETQLEQKFGLKSCFVVDGEDDLYQSLGIAAAQMFAGLVQNGDIVGFARGKSLSNMVMELGPVDKSGLVVTQLVGGQNSMMAKINSDDIVHIAADRLDAVASYLYAPIFLKDKELKESFMADQSFAEAYQVVKACTIAIIGVGNLTEESSFVRNNYFTEDEYTILLENRAVGEICTHYFDIEGNAVSSGIDDRIIAISRDDLKQIPLRVGIAGGREKYEAILGALRGKYINALVTDKETGNRLLEAKSN